MISVFKPEINNFWSPKMGGGGKARSKQIVGDKKINTVNERGAQMPQFGPLKK